MPEIEPAKVLLGVFQTISGKRLQLCGPFQRFLRVTITSCLKAIAFEKRLARVRFSGCLLRGKATLSVRWVLFSSLNLLVLPATGSDETQDQNYIKL